MKSNFNRFMKLRKEILRECKAVLKSDYDEIQCGSHKWATQGFYMAVRVYSDRLNYITDTNFSLKIFQHNPSVLLNVYTFTSDDGRSVIISLPEKFESMTNKEIIAYCNEEISYLNSSN